MRDRFPIFVIFAIANAVTILPSLARLFLYPRGWVTFLLTGHSVPPNLAQAGLQKISKHVMCSSHFVS